MAKSSDRHAYISTAETLKRFAATLVAISPRKVALAALVMLCLPLTEGMGLLLLVPLLQLVGVDAQGESASSVGQAIAGIFSRLGLQPTLGAVLAAYVGVAVCQSALQRWHTMLSGEIRQQAEATLRVRFYRAIGRAQWLHFARSRIADFNQMLTQELDRLGTAAHDLLETAVGALIVAVYVVVALQVSPGMTALVLGCGGVLAWLFRFRVSDSHGLGSAMTATRARLNAAVTEHLGSMKTARCYGATDRHDEMFSQLTEQVRIGNLQSIASFARLRQETVVGSAIVLAVIIYVSRQMLVLPTAHLLMLLFLFARLMPRLTGLIERAQNLATLLPSFARFDEMERECLAAAEPPAELRQPVTFRREIRLDGLSFEYGRDAGKPAVRDVSLVFPCGTTTAIVGPSGAGKSTLADLLLGLIEPGAGRILIDGRPLERAQYAAWRDQIGYVSQDTFLFHDSVRANLLWARPGASEAELQQALRLAAADSFVAELPQGLDTVVGDRGILVSGGERQRLALARALLRGPKLLILDEATNALDSENETRIQEAIDSLRHQMTIIVITHRLSMVRGADQIHVLDQGRIVESGLSAELGTRAGGRFLGLCEAQGIDPVNDRELHVVGR